MNTTDRRMEIINILLVRRRTCRKLAEELGGLPARYEIFRLYLQVIPIYSRAGLAGFS